ncbi:MAG TPA: methionine synthase [Deinococcales bacterium]|nr:methionine synthase [Deinococcales bacterium]
MRLEDALRERILVLDGAMGTMIQAERLGEADYHGPGLPDDRALKGNHDLLNLTRPEIISGIHRAYLAAGADVIETNTFSSTAIAQADYGLQALVPTLNEAGARLAREAADAAMRADPAWPRFVAGSMGPTNRTASMSPRVEDPGFRAVDFDELSGAYREQAAALVRGGVDVLLLETVFDTLNAKAALHGIWAAFEDSGREVPVMVSGTITDASGRTLSGQTVEAFHTSLEHARLLAVGLNCALGAEQLSGHLRELSGIAPEFTLVYPNAGLPNAFGEYDESPEFMAGVLGRLARDGMVNLVGGCCGTTPAHIAAIRAALDGLAPRRPPEARRWLRLSGLDVLHVRPESNFMNIGERTNVSGSARFRKLVRAGSLPEAVTVARQQVDAGAQAVDVNLDDGLLDVPAVMTGFLNLMAAEPDVARAPVVVDSSRFDVIEAGLKCLQGKSLVNSISLKDGEAEFLRRARVVRSLGAAVVAMAFDERGQADTVTRRQEVCARAFRLLTDVVGFAPHDVVLDPNVLTIGTGMTEHDRYAVDFIEATRWIKANLPGALVSGGISNVSFAFRGHEAVRQALHVVFLRHAIAAGLDMGIVNAGALPLESDLDPELVELAEDLILNRRGDATERLTAYAQAHSGQALQAGREPDWLGLPAGERLAHMLVHGETQGLEGTVLESLSSLGEPLAVIEGPLAEGMNRVGDLFASGRMFLPQVVKSARVMKQAVAVLTPMLEARRQEAPATGKVLLATVRGDVHDIGKNIVGVVLACNGVNVIDLGVMTPVERILDTARREHVDVVGLSGLITPSLDEMVNVAATLEREGFTLPLLIGGATTSRAHTAVRIEPAYSGPVVHVQDASRAPGVVKRLLDPREREALAAETRAAYADLRAEREGRAVRLIPLEEARANAPRLEAFAAPRPLRPGRSELRFTLSELVELVDWSPFFQAWELKGRYPEILDDPVVGAQARALHGDALALLRRAEVERWFEPRAVVGLYRAARSGDDVRLASVEGEPLGMVHTLRQQRRQPGANIALADFVGPDDWLGLFAVSVQGAEAAAQRFRDRHDDYSAILVQALADRLVEALAEAAHHRVRTTVWGYAPGEDRDPAALLREAYQGIRPAPGYPACPDHSEKRTIVDLLRASEIGVNLTGSNAAHPPSTVIGYYVAHPEARYFAVGKIGPDQLADYAGRKGWTLDEARRHLRPVLAEG